MRTLLLKLKDDWNNVSYETYAPFAGDSNLTNLQLIKGMMYGGDYSSTPFESCSQGLVFETSEYCYYEDEILEIHSVDTAKGVTEDITLFARNVAAVYKRAVEVEESLSIINCKETWGNLFEKIEAAIKELNLELLKEVVEETNKAFENQQLAKKREQFEQLKKELGE